MTQNEVHQTLLDNITVEEEIARLKVQIENLNKVKRFLKRRIKFLKGKVQ